MYAVEKWFLADGFCLKSSLGVLEVELLQGLDGVVGVTPAAGGVIEGLVGDEVLIGGVEGGFAVCVDSVGVDLNRCAVCGVISAGIAISHTSISV